MRDLYVGAERSSPTVCFRIVALPLPEFLILLLLLPVPQRLAMR